MRRCFGRKHNTLIGSLTQYRTDTGMRILNERSGVSVEINRFFRVECHILAGIDFQYEIFESTQSYHLRYSPSLLGRTAVEFSQFGRCFAGGIHHFVDKIIGIYNRTFTRLHLSLGQFHHTVREMNQISSPLETETVEQNRKHLEMIILFIAHNINHTVDGIIAESQLGRSDVLRHIHRCSVGAEQQFLVESLV